MKPRRTPTSTFVYSLPGGNEDNDLWCERRDGAVLSDWEFTDEERELLIAGGRVQLAIYHEPIPPVSLIVVAPYCSDCKTEEQLIWVDGAKMGQPDHPTGGAYVYACPTCDPDAAQRFGAAT